MIKKIRINWMTCGSCVALNTTSLEELEWVKSVQINLSNWETKIDFDEMVIWFAKIEKQIQLNGFSIEEISQNKQTRNTEKKYLQKFILSALLGLPVFSMMFFHMNTGKVIYGVDLSMWFFALLSFIVVYILWGNFHKNFYKSLKSLHFNMDSLVSLWTQSAFWYSSVVMFYGMHVYFEAAVAIITLINLWKYLEEKSKKKAGNAISKLLELGVKKAHIIENNTVIQKDISDVKIWEIMKIFPWEKIPLDGEIIKGESSINESMITWESLPVEKKAWDKVLWATINCDNYLEVKVEKTSENWMLHKIIQMVNDAQSSRAPIQKLVDKISQVFVPIIIGISILTFLVWFFITWEVSQAIIPAVSVLVIACPCALWLATPAAIMVATWAWAKQWILIKNAQTLEKTKNIDVIVFDKTWTITQWKPQVKNIFLLDEKWIELAQNLANNSHHPLSQSIKSYKNFSIINNFHDILEIKWKWISGKIENKEYLLWNKKLFEKKLFTSEILKIISDISSQWSTPVIFGNKDEILWIFEIIDLPKQESKEVINQLKHLGIETIMLTGDNTLTAEYIAREVWVDKCISEVLPGDKLQEIKKLQNDWKKVAFVWDGINDAPALVQSDLSIAMWTGSDIAIESSDIVITWWSLQKVISSLELSKKTLRNIKQNLFWAFLYNTIWIPLAALWLLNPIFASLAMSFSSISVVLNALRLNRIKK